MRHPARAWLLLIATLSVVFIASGSNMVSALAGEPTRGGSFVFAQNLEPDHLNPGLSNTQWIGVVTNQVYDALVRQDFDLALKPSLAEKWDVSADGRTYTFHLVRDAKFHDGKPLTSADVKFTIESIILPYHNQGKDLFGVVDKIDTPNSYTIIFRLKRAFAPFMQGLTTDGAPIFPKHLWEGTEIPKNPLGLKPIGSGPFIFKEWVRGSHFTLERNPNYWIKGKPYLDRIVIRNIPDANARLQAFESGEIDALFGYFPYSEYARLAKNPLYKTALEKGGERAASISNHLTFNLKRPNFSNVLVRRAIAHALDKKLIIDKSAAGLGREAIAHTPMGLPWSNPTVPQYSYDPVKARTLLDEAGVPEGPDKIRIRARLIWNNSDSEHAKAAEVIAQLLRAVGIQLQLVPMDPGVWMEAVFLKRDFDMTLRGIPTGPDPGISGFVRSWHSKYDLPKPFLNFMSYHSKAVDDLFDKAAVEQDARKRLEYFRQIQTHLMTDLPSIPIRERVEPKVWRAVFEGDVVSGPSYAVSNSWYNVWKK